MCDATALLLVGEPLSEATAAFWCGRLRCDACHWPDVYAVVGSDTHGFWFVCHACAERLAIQTALALAFSPRRPLI